jgi:hypothetical protein
VKQTAMNEEETGCNLKTTKTGRKKTNKTSVQNREHENRKK